jgi:allantoinase
MTDFALTLQGTVIPPDRILRSGYVAVANGRIAEVGQGHPPSRARATGLGKL